MVKLAIRCFFLIKSVSYLSLSTGNAAEPLYFVKVTEKRIAIKDMKDPYGHFIHTSGHAV